ncbi:unnamed protein product [Prunus armeniaca]|uniref:Uncharacterized protein n=1 Tax=Prunus armeniaca TaxID=36596 RepID=A0A6J5WTI4_PRUAR|nr:unnamed protein product [Prunus armeniaca]
MCENVPEVRMIHMYMDHRDNLDDVMNSHTNSNVYCHYSSQLYHYADDVRSPCVILQELPEFDKAIVEHDKLDKATSNEVHKTRKPTPSINLATAKGNKKVAAIDEGSVQHETKRATSKGKENINYLHEMVNLGMDDMWGEFKLDGSRNNPLCFSFLSCFSSGGKDPVLLPRVLQFAFSPIEEIRKVV